MPRIANLKTCFIFYLLYCIVALAATLCVKCGYCDILIFYPIIVVGPIIMSSMIQVRTMGTFTMVHDRGGIKPSVVLNKTIEELAQYKTITFDVENIAETSHNNIGDE